MKYLFFVALFANTVFFFWEITHGSPQIHYSASHQQPSALKEIFLVSELQPEPESPGTDDQAEKNSESGMLKGDGEKQFNGVKEEKRAQSCYEAGPFESIEISQKWLDDASIKIHSADWVMKKIEIPHGFVIFLPPEKSYQQSIANYERLKQQGITDLWLFTTGESKGMISLGIYRNKQLGEKIQQQFIAQGLKARMKPYFKTEQRYFVRFTNETEMNLEQSSINGSRNSELPELQIKEDPFCAKPIALKGSI